jgi:hypothetical protein
VKKDEDTSRSKEKRASFTGIEMMKKMAPPAIRIKRIIGKNTRNHTAFIRLVSFVVFEIGNNTNNGCKVTKIARI